MKDQRPKIKSIKSFSDDHDYKGSSLIESYMKKRSSPELLLQAASEFARSTNPEKEKISDFCRGLYFLERGNGEKRITEARKLYQRSIKELKKVDPNDNFTKDAELRFLRTKISANTKPDVKLLSRSADLLKSLGRTSEYHQTMALFHMGLITDKFKPSDIEEILRNNDLMLKHAKESGDQDVYQKVKSLYHQVKAKTEGNDKIAIDELKKAILSDQKTSDKYGAEMLKTELMMTEAMVTPDTGKRSKILAKVVTRYEKDGQKAKADFALKLLRPTPIKAENVILLADKSIDKLQELNKKIVAMRDGRRGPCAIFYHIQYSTQRIKDVRRIIARMAATRKAITDLHIKENSLRPKRRVTGKPLSKSRSDIFRKIDELQNQMKQDMESLCIYGNLLLDQWSYTIGYIAGIESLRQKDGSTTDFNALVNTLQKKGYNGELLDFWAKHKKDIVWLYFHLRFFRNVFIEHVRKPWQMGNTMGVYGDDFSFHIPAAVGYVKPEDEKKMLEEIYPLSPQKLRDMPDDYWEKKNLKRVLEVTLYHIDEIDKQSDRDKIWNTWAQLGGSTQSYDVIGLRLFNYILSSLESMVDFLDKHPTKITFGEF